MSQPDPTPSSVDPALQALAVASHEVRGALAAIIAHARLLEAPELEPARHRSSVQVIERTGQALLDRFDQVLQSARSLDATPTTTPRPDDLRALIEACASLHRAPAEQQGLRLDFEVDPELPAKVVFDAFALRRVLDNLLTNAIKFTEHGSIRLALRCEGLDRVRIEIIDTGCGIASEDHERVFDPFQRGSASPSAVPGIGLGLTLCRTLMDSMGGTLRLTSMPDRGTTVEVQLPIIRIDRDDAESLRGRRVLLIDDCADTLALLEHQVRALGAEVATAADGTRALAHLQCVSPTTGFDLILLDLEMPGLDGWSTAREIRRLGFRGCLIASSAHHGRLHRNRALHAGCSDFIGKPLAPESLIWALLQDAGPSLHRNAG